MCIHGVWACGAVCEGLTSKTGWDIQRRVSCMTSVELYVFDSDTNTHTHTYTCTHTCTYTTATAGDTLRWHEVSAGVGLNQYDPFSPHARAEHAGTPVSNNSFVIFGGCAG